MKRDHSLCLETEKTYFSTMIVLEEGPTLLSVVWYVNFLRLWKYLYDQSMWMFRIALCCLLICFSTTHKRFQHHNAFACREEGFIGLFVICYLFTACVFSFLFGFLPSQNITSGEIIFIMVMLSVFRTLFSILIPTYNFDNILHVVKEYYGHAKFWINDTLESIYLFFS